MPNKDDPEITVAEVDMSDDDEDRSLADRLRAAQDKVQRKKTAIRAKRRAKAREEEMSDPGVIEEAKQLGGDLSELASTAVGSSGGGSVLSEVDDAIPDVDTSDFDEPLFDGDSDTGRVDPVAVTEEDEIGIALGDSGGGGGGGDDSPETGDSMGGDPDDVLLDPEEADPLSADDDDLF